MSETTTTIDYTIGDVVVKLEAVPVWECSNGHQVMEGRTLSVGERLVAQHLLDTGLETGALFRFTRKAVGLPQKRLAAFLGYTPETISRWETDAQPIPRLAFVALRSLLADRRAEVNLSEMIDQHLQARNDRLESEVGARARQFEKLVYAATKEVTAEKMAAQMYQDMLEKQLKQMRES